jgi:hypothetical protein
MSCREPSHSPVLSISTLTTGLGEDVAKQEFHALRRKARQQPHQVLNLHEPTHAEWRNFLERQRAFTWQDKFLTQAQKESIDGRLEAAMSLNPPDAASFYALRNLRGRALALTGLDSTHTGLAEGESAIQRAAFIDVSDRDPARQHLAQSVWVYAQRAKSAFAGEREWTPQTPPENASQCFDEASDVLGDLRWEVRGMLNTSAESDPSVRRRTFMAHRWTQAIINDTDRYLGREPDVGPFTPPGPQDQGNVERLTG